MDMNAKAEAKMDEAFQPPEEFTNFFAACKNLTVRDFQCVMMIRDRIWEEKTKKNPDCRVICKLIGLADSILKKKGVENG